MNIKDLQEKYKLEKTDFWEMKFGGKAVWIITHDGVEKIAAMEKIKLVKIKVLNSEPTFARFLITMSKVLPAATAVEYVQVITTVGEASKENCKSNYYGCMAEKRGIDRAVLKLINAYQYGIYSDAESEDFKRDKQ